MKTKGCLNEDNSTNCRVLESLNYGIRAYEKTLKNSIPISVIQNKIDEIKLKLKDVSKRREKAKAKEEENILWCLEIRLDEKIKTLQGLLEEGGSKC